MYLKRSLIKRQAKELLKGNFFKLFVISIIVSLCVSLISGIISGILGYNTFFRWKELVDAFSDKDHLEDYLKDHFGEYYDDYFDKYYDGYFDGYFDDSDDSDYFQGFGDDSWDFYNFNYKGELSNLPVKNEAAPAAYNNFSLGFYNYLSYIPMVITALLSPLAVALAGLYVSFIRGKNFEFDEGLKSVFVNAFKVNYIKKAGVYVLRMIIMGLLSLLFVIPGIIFGYSSYFAFQIMCDYPGLTAWEAIKLSKKIIKGNRFELFLMNLSFIPWAFLCVFVFPIIYVLPYFETVNALYYENFRIRAIQQGRVTEDDFLSDAERCAKYGAMGNNQYHSPDSARQGTYYHAPQQTYQPYAPTQNAQPAQPQQPAASVYEAPKPAEPTDYPWEGK